MTEFQKNLTIDDIFELIFKLVPIYCILLLSPDTYQRRENNISSIFRLVLQVLDLIRFNSYNTDQIKTCV